MIPDKILIWVAIHDYGISQPFFAKAKLATKRDICRIRFITTILDPLLKECHADEKYFFESTLASCQYANQTINLVEFINVSHIHRYANPPYSRQLGPIVTFWSRLRAQGRMEV